MNVEIESAMNSETKKFHSILDNEWKGNAEKYPEWATRLGDNRFNDKLNDASYETIIYRQEKATKLLDKIKEINRNSLSSDDQLNYDLFFNGILFGIEGNVYLSYLMPISQMGGIQIGFAGIADYMPFKSVTDYENYISRMRAFPTKVDQTIDLMKRGIESGWVPPRIVLGAVPDQIKTQFNRQVEDSPLYRPFIDFHESIPQVEQRRLSEELKAVLKNDVFSAYENLFVFFTEDYLPNWKTIATTFNERSMDQIHSILHLFNKTSCMPNTENSILLKKVGKEPATLNGLSMFLNLEDHAKT